MQDSTTLETLADMAELFRIFNPRYVASPTLVRSDFDMLSKLTNLEILIVSLDDSSYK